jgi:hypothetical protein
LRGWPTALQRCSEMPGAAYTTAFFASVLTLWAHPPAILCPKMCPKTFRPDHPRPSGTMRSAVHERVETDRHLLVRPVLSMGTAADPTPEPGLLPTVRGHPPAQQAIPCLGDGDISDSCIRTGLASSFRRAPTAWSPGSTTDVLTVTTRGRARRCGRWVNHRPSVV